MNNPSYQSLINVATRLSFKLAISLLMFVGHPAESQTTTPMPPLLEGTGQATPDSVIDITQNWLNARGAGPYYLDVPNTEYVLQTDVATDGSAFAIVAEDVVFDLNGHTITYDNANPIIVFNGSFEAGAAEIASGWNFNSANAAERHQGVWLHNEVYDNEHSLKFSLPAADQHVTSTSKVTLEPNTSYSLSAMFEYGGKGATANPGVKGYVRIVGAGLPTIEASWMKTNWRGIQFTEQEFATGPEGGTYTVEAGIEGGSGVASTSYYIDDIKIQRTKTCGIIISPVNWAAHKFPDIGQYGRGSNATVKNGVINQGSDGATKGHGILIHATKGVTLEDLGITVNGASASAIIGLDNFLSPVIIKNTTLTSNVQTIESRDGFDGAVVKGVVGTFQNNSITDGPHGGFVTAGNGTPSTISGNTIQLKAKYTNAFAIIATRGGSQVYDNFINNGSGEFASRGIGVTPGTADNPTRVYNNTIRVQQLPNNQEYEGADTWGTYGIQVESASHVEIFGNVVYANANVQRAFAFRMNNEADYVSQNVHVHHNTFVANSVSARAASMKFRNLQNDGIRFEDNILRTNDGIVAETAITSIDLVRTHLESSDPLVDPAVFTAAYSPGSALHSELSFIDTTFEDATSRAHFENGIVTYEGRIIDDRMAASAKWATTIEVKGNSGAPLLGANVTVEDIFGVVAYSGVTNAAGQVTAELIQFRTQGVTKTLYNPYTVRVSMAGHITTAEISADQAQTINLELNGL